MKMIEAPSPNFDERGRDIDTIILHYEQAKVSAHYCVEENGDVYRLVEEANRAWHAGVAFWQGDVDINARSIGIEIVNPGHQFGYRDFSKAQIASVILLLKDIRTRHDIAPARVLGHSDVAPRRKEDPGEKFPWKRLADEGLALAPFDGDPNQGAAVSFDDALNALIDIGYDAYPGDYAAGLLAFQRRFCPASLGQGFDARTRAALAQAAK